MYSRHLDKAPVPDSFCCKTTLDSNEVYVEGGNFSEQGIGIGASVIEPLANGILTKWSCEYMT